MILSAALYFALASQASPSVCAREALLSKQAQTSAEEMKSKIVIVVGMIIVQNYEKSAAKRTQTLKLLESDLHEIEANGSQAKSLLSQRENLLSDGALCPELTL